jgi:hypothetical protein
MAEMRGLKEEICTHGSQGEQEVDLSDFGLGGSLQLFIVAGAGCKPRFHADGARSTNRSGFGYRT